jgi:hypothetical protein
LPTVVGGSEIGNKKDDKGSRIHGKKTAWSWSFNLIDCPYLTCPSFLYCHTQFPPGIRGTICSTNCKKYDTSHLRTN